MKKVFFVLAAAMVAAGGCSKSTDNGKDPAGTIPVILEAGATKSFEIEVPEGGEFDPVMGEFRLGFVSPGNMRCITGDGEGPTVWDYRYEYEWKAQITSLGKVSGLGRITRIPSSTWVDELACIQGYGYVVRLTYRTMRRVYIYDSSQSYRVVPGDEDYAEGELYARLYVDSMSADDDGNADGVLLKMQYPFDPKK